MNFQSLSNKEFISSFERAAASERKIMSHIIEYVREAMRREVWEIANQPNIYDFMTKHLKYSKGAASRRISTARLAAQIPEIIDSIKTGELTISQIALLTQTVNAKEKLSKQKVDVGAKREILDAIKQKPAKTEQIISCMLDMPIEKKETAKIQRDGGISGTYYFNAEITKFYEQVKLQMSHVNPNPSMAETCEYAFKKCLAVKVRNQRTAEESFEQSFASEQIPKNPNYISAQVRREIEAEQPCCRWKFEDGTTCGSKFQLEIDHIKPLWAGGDSRKSNLQRLCGTHNRRKYKNEANIHPH